MAHRSLSVSGGSFLGDAFGLLIIGGTDRLAIQTFPGGVGSNFFGFLDGF